MAENGNGQQFADPVTRPSNLGVATPTETPTEEKSKKSKTSPLVAAVSKALDIRPSNVMGYNERTRVVVTDAGGKYQVSKNGKSLRHLAGPRPQTTELDVVDALTSSPFVGTAAALNASVHEAGPNDEEVLRARRAALEAELAAVNEELGETPEEE